MENTVDNNLDDYKSLIQELTKDLGTERLKNWRIKNYLKQIGWNEELIESIMENNTEFLIHGVIKK